MTQVIDPELQAYATETENWVKQVIMKYNICPFARREIERASIRYAVIDESRMQDVLQALVDECIYLDENKDIEDANRIEVLIDHVQQLKVGE